MRYKWFGSIIGTPNVVNQTTLSWNTPLPKLPQMVLVVPDDLIYPCRVASADKNGFVLEYKPSDDWGHGVSAYAVIRL